MLLFLLYYTSAFPLEKEFNDQNFSITFLFVMFIVHLVEEHLPTVFEKVFLTIIDFSTNIRLSH